MRFLSDVVVRGAETRAAIPPVPEPGPGRSVDGKTEVTMKTRLLVAALVFMMVQAVLFGVGTILIVSTPLAAYTSTLMPLHIVISFAIAAPIAWRLAPRLQARYWRRRDARAAAGLEADPAGSPRRL